MDEGVRAVSMAVGAALGGHGSARQGERQRPGVRPRPSSATPTTRAVETPGVLTSLIDAFVEQGQGDVLAVARAFQLSQPGSVDGPPGDAVVGDPGAYPGGTAEPDRIRPSLAPEFLGRAPQQHRLIGLPCLPGSLRP